MTVAAVAWQHLTPPVGERRDLDDGERPDGPGADQNIGYADWQEHRYWQGGCALLP